MRSLYRSLHQPESMTHRQAKTYGGQDSSWALAAEYPMFETMVGSVKLKPYTATPTEKNAKARM